MCVLQNHKYLLPIFRKCESVKHQSNTCEVKQFGMDEAIVLEFTHITPTKFFALSKLVQSHVTANLFITNYTKQRNSTLSTNQPVRRE